jgi:membrane fusion protein (multidrug efflux system)
MTDREAVTDEVAAAAPVKSRSRHAKQWFLWIFGPAIVLAGGTWYALHSGRYEATDNAYLHADIITIASEVAGRVVEVNARENTRVHAGDVLFRIDPRSYELAVSELQAQAIAIGEYLDSSRDAYAAALADLDSKGADLKHELQTLARIKDLREKGVVSQGNLDDAQNAVDTARADRDASTAMAAKAKTLLGGDVDTPVEQLAGYRIVQARLAKAELDLARTVVRAPADGVIGRQSLQVGDFLALGQAAMPLVTDNLWIDANFKETDMTWVRPGQSATLSVDTYSGLEWQAEVASISPASSAMFSVLPAQNATGNWVKVVQRIPVRLNILAPPSGDAVLRAGMSAEIVIDTGSGHTLADQLFGGDAGQTQLAQSGNAVQ